MKKLILLLFLASCSTTKTDREIELEMKLDEANKRVKYYEKQYLKANTQLIEIKAKCIYCAE